MTAIAKEPERSRQIFYNLEFLRVIFVTCAILVHGRSADALRQIFPHFTAMNQMVVEIMFVIGGFLLCRGLENRPAGILHFIKKKYMRLAPPVIATAAIMAIFNRAKFSRALMDSLFIPNLDFGTIPNVNWVVWYASAYFSAIVAMHFILTNFDRKKALFFIALASYGIFAWQFMNGRLITYGFPRAFAAMGIGALMWHFAGASARAGNRWIWTAVEVAAMVSIFHYLGKGNNLNESVYIIVYFCALLFSFAGGRGYLGRFLNRRKRICAVSKYVYSAYVFQGVFFIFFDKYFSVNWTYATAAVAISFLMAVIFDNAWDRAASVIARRAGKVQLSLEKTDILR